VGRWLLAETPILRGGSMSKVLNDVPAANRKYSAEFGQKGKPGMVTSKFAILTCMDARLDPVKFAGPATWLQES
jgi:hypothetical protein